MKIYKKTIFITLLLFCTSVIFAAPKDNKPDVFGALDAPLIDGMTYFYSSIFNFARIAGSLAILLGIVGICWNAFRLWFGTQQIRKAAIDILTKFLLFTALNVSYGAIMWGVLLTATDIGLYAGNGLPKMEGSIRTMYESLLVKVNAGHELVEKLFSNANEGAYLSEENIKALAKGAGMTDEEIVTLANKYNVKIVDNSFIKNINVAGGAVAGSVSGMALGAAIGSVIPGAGTVAGGLIGGLVGYIGGTIGGKVSGNYFANKQINDLYKNIEASQVVALKDAVKNRTGEKQILLLNAIIESLGGQFEDITIDGVTIPKTTLTELNVLLEKYIQSVEKSISIGNKKLTIVSPGSMLKMTIMTISIIKSIGETNYDSRKNIIGFSTFDASLNNISQFIIMWVIIIAITAATCFFCIQYAMTLFEYFITASVGVIFIPFVLFDGTKSFAAKLITLFTSYFIKITVMLLCVVWAQSVMLDTCMTMLSTANMLTLSTSVTLIFTVLLTFIVTQNAPQIALTVLNGSPQLSMGEFLHAAGTVAAGAALAKKAVQNPVTRKAVSAGQGFVRGGLGGIAATRGAFAGTEGSFKQKLGSAVKEGAKIAGSAWVSGIANIPSKMLTGREIFGNKKDSVGLGKGETDSKSANLDRTHSLKSIRESYIKKDDNAKNSTEAKPVENANGDLGSSKIDESNAGKRS